MATADTPVGKKPRLCRVPGKPSLARTAAAQLLRSRLTAAKLPAWAQFAQEPPWSLLGAGMVRRPPWYSISILGQLWRTPAGWCHSHHLCCQIQHAQLPWLPALAEPGCCHGCESVPWPSSTPAEHQAKPLWLSAAAMLSPWVPLQLKGDVRAIVSGNFAAQRSLRFPRIMAIRDDKDAATINTEADMLAEVSRKHDLRASAPPIPPPTLLRRPADHSEVNRLPPLPHKHFQRHIGGHAGAAISRLRRWPRRPASMTRTPVRPPPCHALAPSGSSPPPACWA